MIRYLHTCPSCPQTRGTGKTLDKVRRQDNTRNKGVHAHFNQPRVNSSCHTGSQIILLCTLRRTTLSENCGHSQPHSRRNKCGVFVKVIPKETVCTRNLLSTQQRPDSI